MIKFLFKHGIGGPGYFARDISNWYLKKIRENSNLTVLDFIHFYSEKLKFLDNTINVSRANYLFLKNLPKPTLSQYCYFVVFLLNSKSSKKLFSLCRNKNLVSMAIIETIGSVFYPGAPLNKSKLDEELISHQHIHNILMENIDLLRY
jgi:hypothetical protein